MTFASLSVHICIFRHFQVCQILSQIIQKRHFFWDFFNYLFSSKKTQSSDFHYDFLVSLLERDTEKNEKYQPCHTMVAYKLQRHHHRITKNAEFQPWKTTAAAELMCAASRRRRKNLPKRRQFPLLMISALT